MTKDSLALHNQNDFAALSHWLNQYCEEQGHTCWHNYGPADLSAYEADPVKILLVNSESGGYEGCRNVPPNEYLRWIKDRWRTPRYGSVLVTLIRRGIETTQNGLPIQQLGHGGVSAIYQNDELLEEAMRRTIYMNARITSNDTGSSLEEKGAVISDAIEFAAYRKRFVEVMRPRIIICSGDSAKSSLFIDGGVFEPNSFQNESVFLVDNHIVVSVPHLSRPQIFKGYASFEKIAEKCAQMFNDTSRL